MVFVASLLAPDIPTIPKPTQAEILAKYVIANLHEDFKKDLSANPKALLRLNKTCQDAKEIFLRTTWDRVPIEIENFHKGVDLTTLITRSAFNELCLQTTKDGKVVECVGLVGRGVAGRQTKDLLKELVEILAEVTSRGIKPSLPGYRRMEKAHGGDVEGHNGGDNTQDKQGTKGKKADGSERNVEIAEVKRVLPCIG